MDVKDVSDADDYVGFLRQTKANAERASKRKGQEVRDHPPPQQLVWRFMLKLSANHTRSRSMSNMIATTQVPAPYAPCICSVDALKPIMISEMRLETHYRGRKTLLHVLTPPDRMTAVMAIVEDEECTAVLLQLYHQPDESVVPAKETVQPGRVCIVKEPFFKATTDGSYSVRVDHISDIIWLDSTDERVPPKWKKLESPLKHDSHHTRMQGNAAVQRDSSVSNLLYGYSSAIRAAKTTEDAQLAYLNRSLANLRLGRVENALSDAVLGSQGKELSEKGLFREARALYELRNFSLCREKLQTLMTAFPHNEAAEAEMHRVQARLREQQTGEYSFRQMYKHARATSPIIDSATFAVPVEVRPSPGRGRGLFTTRPAVAGELLLCEKAFQYSYTDKERNGIKILMNLSTNRMTMGGQADLLSDIVQKLYHSPELGSQFQDLHHGDYKAVTVSRSDGNPVVDSFLVEKIISLNSFGAPKTSRAAFHDRMTDKSKKFAYSICGIWPLASHINHRCVSNCRRSFIGDMQIVRATKNLEAGTELFFWYSPPKSGDTYEEAQKEIRNWEFTCDCTLCLERKATPPKVLRARKAFLGYLNDAFKNPQQVQISKVQLQLEKISKTYPTTKGAATIRFELWDPYFSLGAALLSQNKPADAVEMTVKGLEALGFEVTACLPKGDGKLARLEIKAWGLGNEFNVMAFLTLFRAYKRLAPNLCAVARQYIETAYSMVVGEKETLVDELPELAECC
ncbi:TPR domain protein [Pseudomassariella vexata]|uniref:TPR domain protein n=1 Tax=Pseudomassariella vexata TaxID=1141098 RepID=A0A1Y2EAB2_9PEZI|nr:TPR domain protein [Pseudomassariella vexata]ORY68254.1 TPR domain protein [Pseudomassariella vexata]